jgi:DnaK suppressor protein
MLRVKELKTIKEILSKMEKDILGDLQERIKSSNVDEQRDIGDMFDDADIEQSREFNLLLSSRERQKLQQIKAALKRMDAKEYGLCEDCGEEIPVGRLKAMPFATMCVKCKSLQESLEGQVAATAEEKA